MKSAFILIECQNEWLSPKGKLHGLIEDRDLFTLSIGNIEKCLKHARDQKMLVGHVGLRFQKGYPELANGKSGLNKAIPTFGTFPLNEFGSQFYNPFQPMDSEFVVTGRTGASGFSGSNLDIWLRNNKIENIYLVGYATHVCVESTFREAHDKGYNPILITDAGSAFNKNQQEYVVENIVHHFGECVTTAEFLKTE
ncbi:cysteine hydrolase [Desertivirga brevis]|uniref:cysteine hydrolase n=1 Tax=Desertivirga brevis TaxID=2810310 RepID=UPI001A9599AD|nr:cysteine hydrolase [Pedobacter sp. SYSU D00873]